MEVFMAMTPEQIEDLAFQGAGMPKGLNAAEQMLFQSFRRLYAYAKLVQMPPEQGRQEKAELLREFRQRQAQVRHMEKTWAVWKEIEGAANRFGRERTLESAEAFHRAVYGTGLMPIKELPKEVEYEAG